MCGRRSTKVEGESKSVLWGVTGEAGRRTAHGRQFAVGSTQRRRYRRRCRSIIGVLVDGAASGVHEEVDDRRHLEAELLGDRRLDLLARALDLAEDGHQGAPLDLGEHHPRLLAGDRRPRLSARRRRRPTGHIMTSLSTWTHTHAHRVVHMITTLKLNANASPYRLFSPADCKRVVMQCAMYH